MKVARRFSFEAAHRLYNYVGPCHQIHGHRYECELEVEGALDPQTGMVLDFKVLKEFCGHIIGIWDHRILLEKEDVLVAALNTNGAGAHVCPTMFIPTVENMCMAIRNSVQMFLDEGEYGVEVSRVRLYETENCYATWEREAK